MYSHTRHGLIFISAVEAQSVSTHRVPLIIVITGGEVCTPSATDGRTSPSQIPQSGFLLQVNKSAFKKVLMSAENLVPDELFV
jgi:hypothetical protein